MYWNLGYFWLYFGLLLGYLASESDVYEFVDVLHNLHAKKSQSYSNCIRKPPFYFIRILFLIVFYCFYFFRRFRIPLWDDVWSRQIIGNALDFLREAIFLGYSAKKNFREKKLEKKKSNQNKNQKDKWK
jgi:hypothetical protein